MQGVYTDGISIEATPFDLQCKGETYKLDLLYYNNVNRYGEILTSLVYNSGVRDAADLSKIHYEPNKLFMNNSFERTYSFTNSSETSNRWKNADLLTSGISILKDNSYTASHNFSRYNISTDYAAAYEGGQYSYDGWYTIVSVGLPEHTFPTTLPAGTLRIHAGNAEYAKSSEQSGNTDWELLNIINPIIPMYNFIRSDSGNAYDTFDFVVTVKTNTLYKKLLDNKLDSDWFIKMNTLDPKMRTLQTAVERDVYNLAQHMINSINNSLLALLI